MPSTVPVRAQSLVVAERRYANSAAKFWPSLVDDVTARYPEARRLELTATLDGPLRRDHLHPRRALQRGLETLARADWHREMQRTLADLEMFGPPEAVSVRLFGGAGELAHRMELEELNADIFPCMVVWLLEWAGLPAERWNEEPVTATVDGLDRQRNRRYCFPYEMENRHLSEGLYRCAVRLALVRPSCPA